MRTPYVKFFRNVQSQPKRFKHTSRFYNEKKEKQEARRKRIEMEVAMEKGEEVDEYVPRTLSFSRHKNAKSGVMKYTRSQKKAANLRLIIILMILIALFYYGIPYIENIEDLGF